MLLPCTVPMRSFSRPSMVVTTGVGLRVTTRCRVGKTSDVKATTLRRPSVTE